MREIDTKGIYVYSLKTRSQYRRGYNNIDPSRQQWVIPEVAEDTLTGVKYGGEVTG